MIIFIYEISTVNIFQRVSNILVDTTAHDISKFSLESDFNISIGRDLTKIKII